MVVQDAGSSIDLTDTTIRANTPAATIGFGLRASGGASATMAGGSVFTAGRDLPGIHAGNATITATNVAVTTTGNDNAMGVLADGNSLLTLNGGSVTTTGDAVRQASFPHALGARNPDAILIATGTTILTTGFTAMGAVADDGGTMILSGNSIRTQGERSIGLFSVTEQVGAQFPANLTATNVTLETLGLNAHGVAAQARNDVPVETATATINTSSITTRGNGAVGLRATLGDYGTRPLTGRGEAAVIANSSTVLTEGIAAHGALSRDNPTSVTMNQTSVLATGSIAHGSVAEAGGRIIGNDSTVTATGTNASALYVTGTPGSVSSGTFTNSILTNVNGPTIGVGGSGDVTLRNSRASGSGEWLRVGTADMFPPLTQSDRFLGIADPDAPDAPPPGGPLPPPLVTPITPGLANVTLRNSTVIGSAFTAPGSVSNVTLLDNSTWIMTGSSNVTNLINDPSLIQFTPPIGDATLLASYKTLTTVNYLGINGIIGLNTFLGSDPSPSDRLVIDGGNASGFSPLRIANTIGRGALTVQWHSCCRCRQWCDDKPRHLRTGWPRGRRALRVRIVSQQCRCQQQPGLVPALDAGLHPGAERFGLPATARSPAARATTSRTAELPRRDLALCGDPVDGAACTAAICSTRCMSASARSSMNGVLRRCPRRVLQGCPAQSRLTVSWLGPDHRHERRAAGRHPRCARFGNRRRKPAF